MTVFTISPEALRFVGRGLHRPECVLATASGRLYTSDWRGGVTCLHPDGSREVTLAEAGGMELRPNGIAIDADGSFLLANLGDGGGVYRLHRSGRLEAVLSDVDGVRLPPVNFVMVDRLGRYWVSVSTRREPRALGYRPDVADGFIVLVDDKGARRVADGIGYTNEVLLDPEGRWLYVNETFGRRLIRFKVLPGGDLAGRETVFEFGHGTYPDGMAMDVDGGIWVTSIISNRVIRIGPDGKGHTVLEDADPDHVNWAEKAFLDGTMDRPHLDRIRSRRLRNISSLAFGGPDRRTVYLGCLLGDALATFRSPIAGIEPVHWKTG
ncbi:MAG: SMP-30/gluconolactonase/LRE family protein [Desulfobacterales bacterium]|jgi:sugar lactone lactonase YvrE